MPPSKFGPGTKKLTSVDVRWMAQQSVDPKASSVDVGRAVHQQQQQQCHCGVQGRRSPLRASSVDVGRGSGMPGPAVGYHSLRSCSEPVLYVAVSAQACALDHPLATPILVR